MKSGRYEDLHSIDDNNNENKLVYGKSPEFDQVIGGTIRSSDGTVYRPGTFAHLIRPGMFNDAIEQAFARVTAQLRELEFGGTGR